MNSWYKRLMLAALGRAGWFIVDKRTALHHQNHQSLILFLKRVLNSKKKMSKVNPDHLMSLDLQINEEIRHLLIHCWGDHFQNQPRSHGDKLLPPAGRKIQLHPITKRDSTLSADLHWVIHHSSSLPMQAQQLQCSCEKMTGWQKPCYIYFIFVKETKRKKKDKIIYTYFHRQEEEGEGLCI